MRKAIRNFKTKHNIFPRRWLLGITSYSKFIGYIRPKLSKGKSIDYRIWRRLLRDAWEPKELSLPVGKKILVLSPHSDDEAIGAGGILWAHRDVADIHVVLLTDGAAYGFLQKEAQSVEDKRADNDRERARLVEIRNNELLETTAALNAKSVKFLNLADGEFTADSKTISMLRQVMHEIKPDVVILPWFLDGHRDHQEANRIFAGACDDPGILVLGYEIHAISDPNAYFDITDHLDAKLKLIENYKSQIKERAYGSFAQGLAKVRGYQMMSVEGNNSAEAFVALPAEDYCSLVNEIL
jgi:LmbE family N-acetylglucosaminyl deacetylase